MARRRDISGGFRNNHQLQQFQLSDVSPTGRVLGTGSFGSVEELIYQHLVCAGKKLHEALIEDGNEGVPNVVRKYEQECRLMASLRHPNITQFLGLCYLPETRLPVLVMERMETSLEDVLQFMPNIPFILKCSILENVANGLVYLHKREPPVIHRDLTARNVLLTSSLVAKITDMGNSRIIDMSPGQMARTLSMIPGTLDYMPPEALKDISHYGPSLDIFSFGHLSLYTMTQVYPENLLLGTYPDPNNPEKILGRSEVARRGEYIEQLRAKFSQLHPSLVQLIEQCLHNTPEQRPVTDRVLITLQRLREEVEDIYGSGSIVKLDMKRMLLVKNITMKDKRIEELMEAEERCQELEASQERAKADIEMLETQLQNLQRNINENRQLQQYHTAMAEKDRQLQQQQTSMAEKDRQLQQQQTAMAEKDRQLQQQQIAMAEKDRQLQQQQTAMEEKDRQLQQQQTAMEEKDRQLQQQQTAMEEKDSIIQQAIEEKYAQFQEQKTAMDMKVDTLKHILLQDAQGNKSVNPVKKFLGVYNVNVLRGELLLSLPDDPKHTYRLDRDPTVVLTVSDEHVAPLNHKEFLLMQGIGQPVNRIDTFNKDKLDWGFSLCPGYKVYVKLPDSNLLVEKWARATVRYVGQVGNWHGTLFGVEILEDRYCTGEFGSTEGTFQGKRYFHCKDGCGLFVSLDRLSLKRPADVQNRLPASNNWPTRQQKCEENRQPFTNEARKGGTLQPLKSKESSIDIPDSLHPGQRVEFYDKNSCKHYGTVRWSGMKNKLYRIVGIETDSPIYKSDFERSIHESEKSLQTVSKNRVLFLPEVMVDPEGTSAQENL